MRRVIGIDVHRTFGEVVVWEDGILRHLGRVDMTRTALEGLGKSLRSTDEVVIEATGNSMAVSRVLTPFVVQLGPVRGREAHVSEHVVLCLVEEGGELRDLGAELVGNAAPLRPRGLGIVLGKCGGDESGADASSTLAGMCQRVAHEVHAATLPSGVEHLG